MNPTFSLHKICGFVIGGLGAVAASLPQDSHQAASVALLFIVLDTLSGMIAARCLGKRIGSRPFRLGLGDKAGCYGIILLFAYGVGVLAKHQGWFTYALYAVIAAEGFSIIENLRPILRRGGRAMRPISRLLDTAADWIDRLIGTTENEINAPDAKAVEAIAPVGEGGKENS